MGEPTDVVPVEADAILPILAGGPEERIVQATKVSNALARVIKEKGLSVKIRGREHVLYEGWTTLGFLLGVFPRTIWTRPLENGNGWEARVEARTLGDVVVGAAESICTRGEELWKTRAEHAIRSMAQTRAAAKALRMALGFVMALAGYETQLADEAESGVTPPSAPPAEPAAAGPQPPESDYKWGCGECKKMNPATETKCYNCGKERGS